MINIDNPSKYIWKKIQHLNGTAKNTKQIERAVKVLFKEIGAKSASYGYILPEGRFKGHICTSVNDVVCHGLPDYRKIDWEHDIVNVDISFKWKGHYYDTCQSWGSQELSKHSLWLTTKIAEYVEASEFKCSTYDIGRETERLVATLEGIELVEEYGGHGIGTQVHMKPFIPSRSYLGNYVPLFITLEPGATGITVEPVITDGLKYAQTEIQLFSQ